VSILQEGAGGWADIEKSKVPVDCSWWANADRTRRLIVVHRKSRLQVPTTAIASGVEAQDLEQFISALAD
jgi:hypothetical protein